MRAQWKTWLSGMAMALLMLAVAGCHQEAGESADLLGAGGELELSAELVPSEAEIQSKLSLSDEQMGSLREPLGRWRSAMEGGVAAGELHQRGAGHAEAMMEFLEDASETLDTEQFVALIDLIVERHAELRERMQARFEEGGQGGEGRGGLHARHGDPGSGQQRRRMGHPGAGRGGMGPGARFGGLHEGLMEQLELTDEQQAQLEAKRTESKEQLLEQMRDASTMEERHELMNAHREEMQAFVDSILTEEQKATLEELRAERQAERQAERETRREEMQARRLEFLTSVLSLSPEQVEQITALYEEHHAAVKELIDNAGDEGVDRDAIQALAEELHSEVGALLDEDQQARFEALVNLHASIGRRFGGQFRGPRGLHH